MGVDVVLEAMQYWKKAEIILDRAAAEGRELTVEEGRECEAHLAKARELRRSETPAVPDVDVGGLFAKGEAQVIRSGGHVSSTYRTPGEAFTSSEAFKAIGRERSAGRAFSTGLVDTFTMTKGTLMEGAGAPGTGTGGGLLPVPDVAPGVVYTLFQPLSVEGLLMSGVATTNTVRYAVEGTATSGAAGVAEGGDKPQSTLAYSMLDIPVKKVATTCVISDEALDDVPTMQQLVNGRLSVFVQNEVERQLLRGTANGNEITGLFNSSIPLYTAGTADDRATQAFKAFNSMRGSAFLEPEWIVVHPDDYQILRLRTDTAGQFLGGGPWLGSYGNAGQVNASPQITGGGQDRLWGIPTYVSANVGNAGTALIGTRAAAQVWSNGGLRVESTNAHSDFFTKDLVTVRAERRAALTVFRPKGYVALKWAVGPGG
jgi:HK97 family phage major capsid protein